MINKFYVYVHRRLSDNKPFYVGKGTGERAWNKSTRNPYWKNIEKKHGRKVEIIFDNLTEEEAFQCEIDTILEFEYFGYDLVNMTKGGDGLRGHVFSEESKQKMSIAQKTSIKVKQARLESSLKRKGTRQSDTHRSKISLSLKGKPKTEEHRLKASQAKRCTKVYTFVYTDKTTVVCTRQELEVIAGLTRLQISSLFGSRPNSSTHGWSLAN